MTAGTHRELANFIWSICNLLRGPYKRNEYRKVILPLTVLRRFDCLLAPTKARVLAQHTKIKDKPETVVRSLLEKVTGKPFFNLSRFHDMPRLLDDPNQLAANLSTYISSFSKNVRDIMERFAFDQQIFRMAEKNLLFEVVKKFAAIDLSVERVDARRFFVKMPKSLGNKRYKIGDPLDRASEPDQIAEIARLFGAFIDGQTRTFAEEDPITKQQVGRVRVVSRIFDNADFGFHKVTVERPLRLNLQATPERLARLESEGAFAKLITSNKKDETARLEEIETGRARQEEIRRLLAAFASAHGDTLYKNRKAFLGALREIDGTAGVRLSASEQKAIVNALGERDGTAGICRDRDGNPEPDPELRDTESVPLKESIDAYVKREVLPHVSDAWIDASKTKVGYEIPLNRHFYVYEPPRPLEVIEAEIKTLESEILALLKEVTA